MCQNLTELELAIKRGEQHKSSTIYIRTMNIVLITEIDCERSRFGVNQPTAVISLTFMQYRELFKVY